MMKRRKSIDNSVLTLLSSVIIVARCARAHLNKLARHFVRRGAQHGVAHPRVRMRAHDMRRALPVVDIRASGGGGAEIHYLRWRAAHAHAYRGALPVLPVQSHRYR